MQLRNYLRVVRRHQWVVLLLLVIGIALGGLAHEQSTPTYAATADLLLKPNDPAEQIDQTNTATVDNTVYAADAKATLLGSQILGDAGKSLGMSVEDLRTELSVTTGTASNTLTVKATDTSATKARDIANTVAADFISVRKATAQASLQTAADGVGTQLTVLQQRITDLGTALDKLAPGAVGTGQLQAQLTAVTQQYNTALQTQQNLLIERDLKRGEAELISPALTPTSPTGPGLAVMLVLGGLVGLLAGMGVAYLREQLDDRIRSREELVALSGLPLLSEVPVDRAAGKQLAHVATQSDPLGPIAETTRALRTNISFLGLERPVRKLMITSASAGEGKTLVAANLAVAFAQGGGRTLIVSADLRRPRIEFLFALPGLGAGLTGLLANDVLGASARTAEASELARQAVEAAVIPTRVPDLFVLPAGAIPPNPAELLGSHRMDYLLELLEDAFDVLVVDSSPLLPVTDAAVLASKVGNVVLVVDATSTRRRAVGRMVEAVSRSQARILGVVLNKTKLERGITERYGEHPGLAGRPEGAPANEKAEDRRQTVDPPRRRKATGGPNGPDERAGTTGDSGVVTPSRQ